MDKIQDISLLIVVMAAVLCDLQSQRIPNGIIVTGLAWGFFFQFIAYGEIGMILFFGGCLIPVILFGFLYYFRMIGAGDIKLLSVVGGFLGPYGSICSITGSLLLGGLISLAIMLKHRQFGTRLVYLASYLNDCSGGKKWKPYLGGVGEEARFSFSVPVLLAVLCDIGGIF